MKICQVTNKSALFVAKITLLGGGKAKVVTFFHYRERTFMIIKLQLRTKSLAALSQTGLLYCAFLVLNFG